MNNTYIKSIDQFINESKIEKINVSYLPTKECKELDELIKQYNDSTCENIFQNPHWSAETDPNTFETDIFVTGNYPKVIYSGSIKDCIKYVEKAVKKLK